jgi:hypothetical protein
MQADAGVLNHVQARYLLILAGAGGPYHRLSDLRRGRAEPAGH